MADGNYRPPPLATLGGTLDEPGSLPVAGRILLALTWQSSARSREFFAEVEDAGPLPGAAPPTCSPLQLPSRPCDGRPWSGHEVCLAHDDLLGGLARTVAFEPLFPAAFTLPIDDLPPATARYDLARQGGRGTLALAYLVAFVDEDGDGQIRFGTPEVPPEPAVANSAFQGYQPAPGTARVSYYVAFLDGEVDASRIADGLGALAGLPIGFSVWKKTEAVDAEGRSLAVEYSVEPIDTPIELFGYPGVEGLSAWCTERSIERVWLAAQPGAGSAFRCTASPDAVSCERLTTTAACSQLEERYQVSTSCVEPPPPVCAGGGWATTSPMPVTYFGAALLPSGKVLVFGTDYPTTGAELYDPVSDEWWLTGSMAFPRNRASVTRLASGKVLVAGGASTIPENDRSAEIYDPETGTWTATGSMATARHVHTATLLPSGKVLVAGGANYESTASMNGLKSAELYDPATGTWAPAGEMSVGRIGHVAVLLESGEVLVAGGYGLGGTWISAEIYDPATGTWRATEHMRGTHQYGTATLLPSGRVLVLGDLWGDATLAEVFDPATETWIAVAPMPRGRNSHGAALLPSGHVLVAAGEQVTQASSHNCLSTADLYDPVSDTWSATSSLGSARSWFATIPMPSGAVLVVGGDSCGAGYLPTAEVYCEPAAGGGAPP
jgi:N-acetylneuraminic acid mutarotase